MNSSDIARVCHEANRAYCMSIGDTSQVSWDELPASKKVSTIHGVETLLQNPGLTAEEMHLNWTDEKLKSGWKWGEQQDDAKKLHPNIVEFDQLPHNQQLKDDLFVAIVLALSGAGDKE